MTDQVIPNDPYILAQRANGNQTINAYRDERTGQIYYGNAPMQRASILAPPQAVAVPAPPMTTMPIGGARPPGATDKSILDPGLVDNYIDYADQAQLEKDQRLGPEQARVLAGDTGEEGSGARYHPPPVEAPGWAKAVGAGLLGFIGGGPVGAGVSWAKQIAANDQAAEAKAKAKGISDPDWNKAVKNAQSIDTTSDLYDWNTANAGNRNNEDHAYNPYAYNPSSPIGGGGVDGGNVGWAGDDVAYTPIGGGGGGAPDTDTGGGGGGGGAEPPNTELDLTYNPGDYSGDAMSEYANYDQAYMADGGPVRQMPMDPMPMGDPSRADNLQRNLSEGEFVIPADVAKHFGTKHFDRMIEMARKPKGIMSKPQMGMADGGPVQGPQIPPQIPPPNPYFGRKQGPQIPPPKPSILSPPQIPPPNPYFGPEQGPQIPPQIPPPNPYFGPEQGPQIPPQIPPPNPYLPINLSPDEKVSRAANGYITSFKDPNANINDHNASVDELLNAVREARPGQDANKLALLFVEQEMRRQGIMNGLINANENRQQIWQPKYITKLTEGRINMPAPKGDVVKPSLLNQQTPGKYNI